MPVIELELFVVAPVERVFDLSRSVDLHVHTAARSGERAVGGVTRGLLSLGDEVVWSARHLGLRRRLTSCITEFDRPRHFRDSMVRGAFARFDHDHHFEEVPGGTMMFDRFDFAAPWGLLGSCASALVVTRHMRTFLRARNESLKQVAESAEWRRFLDNGDGPDGSP